MDLLAAIGDTLSITAAAKRVGLLQGGLGCGRGHEQPFRKSRSSNAP